MLIGDEARLFPSMLQADPGLPRALAALEDPPFSVSSLLRKLETLFRLLVFFISFKAALGVVLVESDRPSSPIDCLRLANELALFRTLPGFLEGSG